MTAPMPPVDEVPADAPVEDTGAFDAAAFASDAVSAVQSAIDLAQGAVDGGDGAVVEVAQSMLDALTPLLDSIGGLGDESAPEGEDADAEPAIDMPALSASDLMSNWRSNLNDRRAELGMQPVL